MKSRTLTSDSLRPSTTYPFNHSFMLTICFTGSVIISSANFTVGPSAIASILYPLSLTFCLVRRVLVAPESNMAKSDTCRSPCQVDRLCFPNALASRSATLLPSFIMASAALKPSLFPSLKCALYCFFVTSPPEDCTEVTLIGFLLDD